MNLSEAKQNAKDLNQSLAVLIGAVEGIKDSDFEALQKRKDALEAAIADTQKRLKAASAEADEKIAKAEADTAAQLADLNKQIKDAETKLANFRVEANVSRDVMQMNAATEKAQLLKENTDVKNRLDGQIAQRQKQLDEINLAIEEGKKRFA